MMDDPTIQTEVLGFPNLSFVPGIISADCNHPFTCGVLIEDLLPLLTNPDLSRSLDLHQQVDQGQGTGKGQDLLKVVEDLLLIHHM